MKLCIDCKYIRIPASGVNYARCRMTESTSINPVDGSTIVTDTYCSIERNADGNCGPDAKRFQPAVAGQEAA